MVRAARIPPVLAISVFNAEEVRNALAGGAAIIDCEDPRAAIGMFEPRVITDIAYAVRQFAQAAVPTSANIGIPAVIKGANADRATLRPRQEIEAKAAQEALGLAAAMDVGDGRPNIIKFEVDGLQAGDVASFVHAVKDSIRNSRQFQHHRLIASCLELDWDAWASRRTDPTVIRGLLDLGEFSFGDGEDAFDLFDHYTGPDRARAQAIIAAARSDTSKVQLNNPSQPTALGLPANDDERLRYWAKTLAEAGADGLMIDTPIQAKVAGISLLKTFSADQLRTFSEYCAYLNVQCWLAGSITATDAAILAAMPEVDVIMCRGAASADVQDPFGSARDPGRSARRISVALVSELAQAINEASNA